MDGVEEIKKRIAGRMASMKKEYGVKRIGIFGSYVRGKQKKGSDVDILVEFGKPVSLFEFVDLERYLQVLLGKKVDLVSKKALKPHIGRNILREVVYV